MNTAQQLPTRNPLGIAWVFGLTLSLLIPALFFSQLMTSWTPAVALVGLGAILCLRGLALGQIVGHRLIDSSTLLLLLLLPINLWVTPDPTVTLPQIYAFGANLTLFWAVAAQRNSPWLRWSGWGFLFIGLMLAIALVLTTQFNKTKLPFIDHHIYALLPSGGYALWDQQKLNPNMSGGVLALFLLPVMVLSWRGQSWQQRDLAKFISVLMVIVLLLTQSRGAILTVGIALLVITSLQSRWWGLFWLILGLSIGMAAYRFGSETSLAIIFDQNQTLHTSSLAVRRELWLSAVYLIRDFPLTGVGLGQAEISIQILYPSTHPDLTGGFDHVHNLYLQAGAEMGLIALAAHLVLFGLLFYLLLRHVRHRGSSYLGAYALCLLGSLITLLIHGLFEAITASPYANLIVWGLLGLMAAIATSEPPDDSRLLTKNQRSLGSTRSI